MKKEQLLDLYHQMVLIRRVEERGAELYQAGKIGGFMHLYIGQEAVSTGLIAAREPRDRVHREPHRRDHVPLLAIRAEIDVSVGNLTRHDLVVDGLRREVHEREVVGPLVGADVLRRDRVDVLERRADLAEGHADALSLGAPPRTLDDEIAELRASDKVDAELEALKASLARRGDARPRHRPPGWPPPGSASAGPGSCG